MSVNNMIEILVEALEKAKEAMKPLPLPAGDMSLNEAMQTIRATLPAGRSANVNLSVWHFTHTKEPDIEYTVYDEKRHYKANTLREAVAACVAAYVKAPAQTIEDADVMLAEAVLEANPQSDTRALETAIDAQAAAEF